MAEGDPSVTSEIPTVQTDVQSVTTSHTDCGSLLSNVSLAGRFVIIIYIIYYILYVIYYILYIYIIIRLAVSVWEVYSDSVQLDWYITLQQKFRLVKGVPQKYVGISKVKRYFFFHHQTDPKLTPNSNPL